MAEEHVGRDQLSRLTAVGVEVGDDAGVEPESLRFCLEVLLSSPPFARAKPELRRRSGDVLQLSYLELDDEPSTVAAETPLPALPVLPAESAAPAEPGGS